MLTSQIRQARAPGLSELRSCMTAMVGLRQASRTRGDYLLGDLPILPIGRRNAQVRRLPYHLGVVTFSLLNLFFSIEAKDQRQSAFSLDTFSDRTFI